MIAVLRENRTLREMLIGIVAAGLVVGVICYLISGDYVGRLIGLGIGLIGAMFMAVHMAYTIEDVVLLDEKNAIAYSRKMTIIRYVVVCILVVAVGAFKIGSAVTCVIGIILLKAGAYLQPIVHRITCGKDENRDNCDE